MGSRLAPAEDIGLAPEEVDEAVRPPPMYQVVLLNDDFTPMEFVVALLERVFRMSHARAMQVMLDVHQKGRAICGVYTREVAETKVSLVIELARDNDHPLQCVAEPVGE
ncbi:MAG: ATP-dependent Clp protease adapter ClpS [Pseudomonadota bacterium]